MELVIDDSFIDLCIEATNEHAAEDASFIKEIGIIEKSEKGRAFMKGFLAVKWHLSLLGYSQKQWAWSEDPFKNKTEIKKGNDLSTIPVNGKTYSRDKTIRDA